MESQIVKGIVLSSCDYKEKDKLVELFTVEQGKIVAVLKGCKAPNAKLKFAFQPFCFAEYTIIKVGKFYQITNASLIDSFFDLTADLDKYYLSNVMLEMTSVSVDNDEQNPQLFVLLANAIKYVCYDNINPYLVTLKFCNSLMDMLGYKINFAKCSSCGLPYTYKVYLNLDSGEFVCNACKTINSILVSNQSFAYIKIVNNTNFDRLNTIKIANEVAKECIIVVCKNLEHRLYKNIKSIKFI